MYVGRPLQAASARHGCSLRSSTTSAKAMYRSETSAGSRRDTGAAVSHEVLRLDASSSSARHRRCISATARALPAEILRRPSCTPLPVCPSSLAIRTGRIPPATISSINRHVGPAGTFDHGGTCGPSRAAAAGVTARILSCVDRRIRFDGARRPSRRYPSSAAIVADGTPDKATT